VHGAVHPARAPCSKDIQLIGDLGNIEAATRDLGRHLFGIEPSASTWRRQLSIVVGRLCIINYKLGAKKIGPEMREMAHYKFILPEKKYRNIGFFNINLRK